MDTKHLSDTLRALAQGDRYRSETARLRDVFEDVEAALAAGVRRQVVLDALHQAGFSMTLKSFESALRRIRRARLPTVPSDPAAAGLSDATSPALGSSPPSKRQQRERVADQFIKPETTNSLVRQLLEKP